MTTHQQPRPTPVLAGVALATALTWAALFAWDNEVVVRDGIESGPYEAWQVLALVGLLAVVVVASTALGQDPLRTSAVLAGTLAACFAVSFAGQAAAAEDASFWPIGVALIAGVAFAGSLGLAAVAAALGLPGAPERW